MARSDFGPEVRAGMQGNANTPARPSAVRKPTSPGAEVSQEARDSSGNTGVPPRGPGPGRGGMPGMNRGAGPMRPPVAGGMPAGPAAPDAHHIAAAASIAHAILGNRGLR